MNADSPSLQDLVARATIVGMDYAEMTRIMTEDIREHGEVTQGPMKGKPLMLLTTIGRKTGEKRTSIITYSRDGDAYAIAASKGGAPTHPAWYHNLVAKPEVTVETGGETFIASATVADAAKRDELWDRHVALLPEFGEYPKKTDRVIPMILLERVG
jgi:deazaflavin-dependent oxidoreductase (nitroreductase family)